MPGGGAASADGLTRNSNSPDYRNRERRLETVSKRAVEGNDPVPSEAWSVALLVGFAGGGGFPFGWRVKCL